MARLLIVKGAQIGIDYELGDVTDIGRSSECTIQLLDPSVSRRHARIVKKDRGYAIGNVSATAGVLVNGRTIRSETRLADNDEIAVGEYGFVFNPDLTLIRARCGDQYLVISPHRPDRIQLDAKKSAAPLKDRALRALSGILERCLLEDDLAACLDAVLGHVLAFFSMDRGFVALFKGDGVELAAAAGDRERLIVSRTIMETVKKSRSAVVSQDACSDVQLQQGLSILEGKLRTVVCMPLLDGESVLGFMQVDSSGSPARIPAEAFTFLDTLSRCLGKHVARMLRLKPLELPPEPPPDFIASSKIMKSLLGSVDRAAATDSTCVIFGETGTGKEVVARMIHDRSARSKGPFIAVNCAAIPETIIESELFGFEKGAFTGAYKSTPGKVELADGGTLFLDEIGDMSPYAQAKLLRFLQERVFYRIGAKRYTRVDVRIIAATNRNLEDDVDRGRFRQDLFYRLAVIPIPVPPLRDRPDDIRPMAEAFLAHFCRELKRPPMALPPAALERLQAYGWPGNVRELRNMMERMAVLGRDTVWDLLGGGRRPAAGSRDEPEPGEKARIVEALRRNRGNKSRAARDLDISRPTLDSKIKKYGIDIFS
jgi:Nif-specific regulatory protein